MAATRVAFALDALADLDREISTAVANAELADVAEDPALVGALRVGLAQLQRVQRRARTHRMECDHEWRASLLRARTLVVLGQLQLLEHAARQDETWQATDACDAVGELRRFLIDRIVRILRALQRATDEHNTATCAYMGRRMLYAVALGKAECGFASLATEPRVAHVLATGVATASPLLAMACQGLLLALGKEELAVVHEVTRRNASGPDGSVAARSAGSGKGSRPC